MKPVRLTIVATHPAQYAAPWFRHIAKTCPELDLRVLYASIPTADQQGVDFGQTFQWDVPLLDGYRWRAVRASRPEDRFDSSTFRGLDVPEIGDAIMATDPDVVLVPGWHSIALVRAIRRCRSRGVPLLYRGDTHLGMRPPGVRGPLWNLKTRALLWQYAAYLSVGSLAREYLLAHGCAPTAIYASPHSVDNAFFANGAAPFLRPEARADVRRALGVEADDFAVLFAAKLTPHKRPLDVVRAMPALGPRAVLLVAGSGAELANVQSEAERLGVRARCLGFQNQADLPRLYAVADTFVLPSEQESWGLTVNEALATGLPVVVSDRTGCAADLVTPGQTGEVFPTRDVAALARALIRVREMGGRTTADEACRARAERFSFAAATTGLVAACQSVVPRPAPRVVVCAGGMVILGGLERLTFEVLRTVRASGGAVHCILNTWEDHRIVPLADDIGASRSGGYYWYQFRWRTRNPLYVAQMAWDMFRTSVGLLWDALRFRATHVLIPEYGAVVRNAPALALLRLAGVRVIFRVANAPDRGRFYDLLWRWALPPFVDRFVANSRFSRGRLREVGVPEQKIALVRNCISRRQAIAQADADVVALAGARRTILVAGQIAPFKGTHLAVDAVLALVARGYDIQALIVGPVPEWPADLVEYVAGMRERIQAAGAADRVQFVGAREDVPGLMRASYVLAAPILQEETFGNVLLEARDAGLPVVTFDRGGLPELVVDRETGFICASADLDGLLEGLRFFLDHPERRALASAQSLRQQELAEEDCTPARFTASWTAIFHDGLAEPAMSGIIETSL